MKSKSEICQSCHKCCRGLNAVQKDGKWELEFPTNEEALEFLYLPDEEKEAHPLNQLCSQHDGDKCTIYADRPEICREFICHKIDF